MANTRSQTARNISTNVNGTDRYSDAESEDSVPDGLTREQMSEFDNGALLNSSNMVEQRSVIQRFSGMNKQITELTNLILVLTEKTTSSNREGNDLNTVSTRHEIRSDMVTGASTSNAHTNPPQPPTAQYLQSSAHQIEDIVTKIHHLRHSMTDSVKNPKILQTQVPLFRGNREKYNEFEQLLLDQKLTYLFSKSDP